MPEHTSRNVSEIEQTAKKDDLNAQKARVEVNEVVSHMSPERQYSEDPTQNKR
jgi:hypothetical protein